MYFYAISYRTIIIEPIIYYYTSVDPKYVLKGFNDRLPAAEGAMPSGRGNVERRRCQMVVSGGARQRLHCHREGAK